MKIIILILLILSLAASKKMDGDSIYEPFHTNQNRDRAILPNQEMQIRSSDQIKDIQPKTKDQQKSKHQDHKKKGEAREQDKADLEKKKIRSQQNQEFNRILAISMIIATPILACTILYSCLSGGSRTRSRSRKNNTNNIDSYDEKLNKINKEIAQKQKSIDYLKNLALKVENQKKAASMRKMRQLQQQQITRDRLIMQEGNYHNVQYYHTPQNYQTAQYYQNYCPQPMNNVHYYRNQRIPVGRPISQKGDNNSSFASDYPVL